MEITRIERQSKQKNRYSIYLDNQFWLGISEDVLLKYNLRKGMQLDSALQKAIKAFEAEQKLYQKVLNYLSYGLRSQAEIDSYLRKEQGPKAVEDEAVRLRYEIIDKLENLGLVDDSYYAQAYSKHQASINRKGPKLIYQELLNKGIAEDIARMVVSEYSEELIGENITYLAQKVIKGQQRLTPIQLKNKLLESLIRKGYPTDNLQVYFATLDFLTLVGDQRELLEKEASKYYRKYQAKATGYTLRNKLFTSLYRKGFASDAINQWLDAKQLKQDEN